MPSKLVWGRGIMVPGTIDASSVAEQLAPILFHEDPTLLNEPDIDSGDVILVKCKLVFCFVRIDEPPQSTWVLVCNCTLATIRHLIKPRGLSQKRA